MAPPTVRRSLIWLIGLTLFSQIEEHMPKPVDQFYCLPAGVLLICGSDVCTSEGTHLIMIVDCTKTAFFKCTEVQRKFNTNFMGSLNASLFAVPSNSIVKVVQYVAC
ncbi:MAG: hypothetical protein CBE00_03470 [Planctomycetaceae bacterium TMED240]|nr:hypothetical protein [Rhodopirellula sp.]OUX07943.1 MAG: hypothetical protein CBE00_03470 [Planctomycetaceae bacterium TMED240]